MQLVIKTKKTEGQIFSLITLILKETTGKDNQKTRQKII